MRHVLFHEFFRIFSNEPEILNKIKKIPKILGIRIRHWGSGFIFLQDVFRLKISYFLIWLFQAIQGIPGFWTFPGFFHLSLSYFLSHGFTFIAYRRITKIANGGKSRYRRNSKINCKSYY